jgi:hypothetical protein
LLGDDISGKEYIGVDVPICGVRPLLEPTGKFSREQNVTQLGPSVTPYPVDNCKFGAAWRREQVQI